MASHYPIHKNYFWNWEDVNIDKFCSARLSLNEKMVDAEDRELEDMEPKVATCSLSFLLDDVVKDDIWP